MTSTYSAEIGFDESSPCVTVEEAKLVIALSRLCRLTVVGRVSEDSECEGAFFVMIENERINAALRRDQYWQWLGDERQYIAIENHT
jgi:hypothetical protein